MSRFSTVAASSLTSPEIDARLDARRLAAQRALHRQRRRRAADAICAFQSSNRPAARDRSFPSSTSILAICRSSASNLGRRSPGVPRAGPRARQGRHSRGPGRSSSLRAAFDKGGDRHRAHARRGARPRPLRSRRAGRLSRRTASCLRSLGTNALHRAGIDRRRQLDALARTLPHSTCPAARPPGCASRSRWTLPARQVPWPPRNS